MMDIDLLITGYGIGGE